VLIKFQAKTPGENIGSAVDMVKAKARAKFDEAVDISVNLGVDPRKIEQNIRGVVKLPHGTGKTLRIGVFARGDDAQQAIGAGADVVGAEDLVKRIEDGDIYFDVLIATPEMMGMRIEDGEYLAIWQSGGSTEFLGIVKKLGKILGPRGLMPDYILGTVTNDIANAIKDARTSVTFRVERIGGIVHARIGKVSFSAQQLLDNIRAFMLTVNEKKPKVFTGDYIQKVHLSSTMGPSIKVDVASVDPTNPMFFVNPT